MLKRLWLIFAQTVTVCAGVGLAVVLWEHFHGRPDAASLPVMRESGTVLSYSEAVKKAAPAVVNIYTTQAVEEDEDTAGTNPAGIPRSSGATPLGSGVVVSRNGFILTNNHVIEDLTDISVALHDGREFQARRMGIDPETDLALLKVDAQDLSPIEFGSSDTLEVGDVVLAIGNPFNVGQTVTMGIVSALGRHSLGLNSFEDFIQTDAAINRGNSGGALINSSGQLIGINTAIFSPDMNAGTSVGIGFAIPTRLVNEVLPALMKSGRVRRGYLGLVPQALTPEIADKLKLGGRQGVLVAVVKKDAAAWASGIREGDLITSVDGQPVTDVAAMMRQVSAIKPGRTVEVMFYRGGKKWRTQVTLQERPPLKSK
ncbi:trypsin-like peptidase domain-containing protein [Mesosutterella sp. AGMB02718]|uniref:Trypsin-like peptidase domain-containing protein n=1 Tax=Mesosutterella faecium TaxID=2925194 RepID=A0ABT7IK13_9BURK|nr:trypsin-like peptidase domain-containing protein [Mesosutterella sp. AGMB02718]MDL2058702.1 trypsin-like peptidase domain-containing protein [Mesosutterella sp. AGMB02718]